jgi:hypothetical protein
MNRYGTLSVLDLIDAQADLRTVTVFGEDRLFSAIDEAFRIHNTLLNEQIAEFVDFTTDQLRRWGGEVKKRMKRLDEFGATDVSKVMPPAANVGFPLFKWGDALQWTRDFFINTTVRDFTKEIRAIQDADVENVLYQIKKSFYHPTNNLTYVDQFTNGVTLPLRALLNGDGTPIPRNPATGATFDPLTHSHYLNSATLDKPALNALINTVLEHGVRGALRIVINQAQEEAMMAINGFYPFVQGGVRFGSDLTFATAQNLDQLNPTNRQIGIYGPAAIWVKHWVLPNYVWCYDTARDRKVLAMRRRPGVPEAGFGNLRLVYDNENFPLRANQYMREFGVSVNDRAAGAVLFIGGGGVYVEPAIPIP